MNKYKNTETKDLEFMFNNIDSLQCISVINLCNELLKRDTEIPKEKIKQVKKSAKGIMYNLKRMKKIK